ncbi:hypothetical protein IEQ34_005187 [Dendrobium chrysotoxum]|uniref:25S rRNA (uridine-N(3))-methyltransferase BMT5-like domain-containing protein n=1 Tax=Dendrobium chrysotoxum TaxID=161865 RepID=A0AAV7HAC2_DENCH|nr:hypothetical protein IEQ34_005187 [Dendrobium chrysotoxum]
MGEAAAAVSSESGEGKREIWIKHYSSSHRILLVGEGDFSFSACLAKAFGSAMNMVATSYDNLGKLLEKHSTARIYLDELKSLGCTLLHGINVKDMHEYSFLKAQRFDRIIFNFPHAGHHSGLREIYEVVILMHKKLLCDFFSSARCLLSENGEIHVSHRDDHPYNKWYIRGSAKERGLILKEMVGFQKEDYPDYENKRGGDIRSNETFPLGNMTSGVGEREIWIMHYSSSHRILLVGEGDFSFSACLARAFGLAKNMIATSYDNLGEMPVSAGSRIGYGGNSYVDISKFFLYKTRKLLKKFFIHHQPNQPSLKMSDVPFQQHWSASIHLDELKRLGCTLLHEINVKDMHEDDFLKAKRFDRIIFNFPHSGHEIGLHERDEELILRHRELLRDFFSSARCLLTKNGEIHVSHRDDEPYIRWKIRSSANKRGLILKEMVEFQKKDYPGYHNKRGGDIKSNKTFPLGDRSFTFKFSLNKDLEDHEILRKHFHDLMIYIIFNFCHVGLDVMLFEGDVEIILYCKMLNDEINANHWDDQPYTQSRIRKAAASSSSGKTTGGNAEGTTEKCVKHWSSSQRILLVGEGDFSFSACLARDFGSAKNMVATSYDDKVVLQYVKIIVSWLFSL